MKAFFSLQGRVLSERPRQHKLALGSFQFPGGCFHAREDPTPSTPRCHALVDAAILGDYSMTKAIFLGIVLPRGPIRSSRPFVLSKILNFNKGLMQTLPAGNTNHIFINPFSIWRNSHDITPASSLSSQLKLPLSFATERQACDLALSLYTST